MAKLPPRIPSEQVEVATSWLLQDLADGQANQILRTKKPAQRQKRQLLAKGTLKDSDRPRTRQDKNAIIKGKPPFPATDVESEPPPPQKTEPPRVMEEESFPPTVETAPTAEDNSDPETNLPQTPEPMDRGEDAGFAEGFKKGETEGYVQGEQKGYSAGVEAGKQAGRTEAEAAYHQEVAAQKEVVSNLVRALSEPTGDQDELENGLATFVTELVQVVLMGEIKTESEHIQHLVRGALSALPHNTSDPKVYLNSSDLTFVEESLSPDIKLVADAGLARGGCRVQTEESTIEASLSERLRAALIATFGRDPSIALPTEQDLQDIDSDLDPHS